jgi:hypothetical protein
MSRSNKKEYKIIDGNDIADFLATSSDFAFELKVLKMFKDAGFECQHAGLYDDPMQKKSREFDIRAKYGLKHKYLLAVECKNISDKAPLLVHCTKRDKSESFHELIVSTGSNTWVNYEKDSKRHNGSFPERSVVRHIENSLYKVAGYVGRSTDQVQRCVSGDNLSSDDSEVFDKFSQAINSSQDLIDDAFKNNEREVHIVIPVLVLPKDRLWKVCYNEHGEQIRSAKKAKRIPYYIGKKFTIENAIGSKADFTISHLEIVTIDFVPYLLKRISDTEDSIERRVFTDLPIESMFFKNS